MLSPPDFTRRIPQLDGLRGVAIALVVLFCYINFAVDSGAPRILNFLVRPTNLGWSGVDLFFVLSGFLIGGILLDARESPNYFRVREHRNLRVRIVANYGPSPNCSQFYAFFFYIASAIDSQTMLIGYDCIGLLYACILVLSLIDEGLVKVL